MKDLNTKAKELYAELRKMGLSHKVALSAVIEYVIGKASK